MRDQVRQVIKDHGGISVDVASLADGDDLYQAGKRSVFESVDSISAALEQIGVPA
jgi:hypothetical protein